MRHSSKAIVIEDRQAPNAKVRVAIHELAHALGSSSQRFGRQRAEVIVECAAFAVAAGLHLDTGSESIPYVAGWGENGALDAIRDYAATIDIVTRRIEDALAPASNPVAEPLAANATAA